MPSSDLRPGQLASLSDSPANPLVKAQRDLKKTLPRRFYREACAQEQKGSFVLLLDGRMAKTPGGHPLALPTLAAAQAVAAEWMAVGEVMDPVLMPLTRLVNSAIDGVASRLAATAAEIVKYAGSDLVCYRATEPESLARAQTAAWDPVLAFARAKLGACFLSTVGVRFIEQPDAALGAVRAAVDRIAHSGPAAPFALAALSVMTTLTGSALLALAVAQDALSPADAWRAAHVDEDFEMATWGKDVEALRRRAAQWTEMEAAAKLFETIRGEGLEDLHSGECRS